MAQTELEALLNGKEITLREGRKILAAEFDMEVDEDDPVLIPWCLGLIAMQNLYPHILSGAQYASDRIADETLGVVLDKMDEQLKTIQSLLPRVYTAAKALDAVEQTNRHLRETRYELSRNITALEEITTKAAGLSQTGLKISPGVLFGLGAAIAFAGCIAGVLLGVSLGA